MKKKYTRVQLESISEQELDSQLKEKRLEAVYLNLLRVLAQACDEASKGENVWVSIGTTRDRTALVLSVHGLGDGLSVYGPSLAALAMSAESLL